MFCEISAQKPTFLGLEGANADSRSSQVGSGIVCMKILHQFHRYQRNRNRAMWRAQQHQVRAHARSRNCGGWVAWIPQKHNIAKQQHLYFLTCTIDQNGAQQNGRPQVRVKPPLLRHFSIISLFYLIWLSNSKKKKNEFKRSQMLSHSHTNPSTQPHRHTITQQQPSTPAAAVAAEAARVRTEPNVDPFLTKSKGLQLQNHICNETIDKPRSDRTNEKKNCKIVELEHSSTTPN